MNESSLAALQELTDLGQAETSDYYYVALLTYWLQSP